MSYAVTVILYLFYVLFTFAAILLPICSCIRHTVGSKLMGIWLLIGMHAVWMLSAFFIGRLLGL